MRKREREKFAKLLKGEKQKILLSARQAVAGENVSSHEGLMDDIDQASSELESAMNFRFRDRERNLLKKIEKSLHKISEGTFGICETCEEPISLSRLNARPVAELCIACKEEAEKDEGRV